MYYAQSFFLLFITCFPSSLEQELTANLDNHSNKILILIPSVWLLTLQVSGFTLKATMARLKKVKSPSTGKLRDNNQWPLFHV